MQPDPVSVMPGPVATAAGFLDLVLPVCPEALIPPAARARLGRWAASRPAIPWIGFEIPFASTDRVDAHQGIRIRDLATLDRWTPDRARDPMVRSVTREWRRRDGASAVHNLVLEYDLPMQGDLPERVPAVFAGFRPEASPAQRRQARHDLLVAGGIAPDLIQALDLLEDAHDPAWIGHVGVMASRPGQGLRINLRDLPPDRLPALLDNRGRARLARRVDNLLSGIVDLVDRVVLCLDVATEADATLVIGPRIGLEITVEGHLPLRWGPVFAWLVSRGLCDQDQAAAALTWPGMDNPVSVRDRWPLDFILDDLRRDRQAVAWVRRYISHVKLVVEDGAPEVAKLYLGACGEHSQPETAPVGPSLPVRAASPSELSDGIARAVQGLCCARGQTGFWFDFTANGCSDEWVSAFVAGPLARAGGDAAGVADDIADWLLRRRRPGAGWGFDAGRPADADSTVWVLRLLDRLGRPLPTGVLDWLAGHVVQGRGLRTYRPAGTVGGAPLPYGGGDWALPHVCVTAAGAGHPALTADCLPPLLAAIGDDAVCAGYWWDGTAYPTAMAAEALATAGGDDGVLHRMADAAMGRLANSGIVTSPFHLALTLRVAFAGGRMPVAALCRLLALQGQDGLWAGGADLRIPPPVPSASATRIIAARDDRGLFTTAAVLDALLSAREALTSREALASRDVRDSARFRPDDI